MSDIGHFPCNEVFETNLQIRWLNPSIPPGFRCNPAWATHTVDWKWVTAWVPKEVSILAGHSKWAQIKRKKAINDKQRGRVISKHIRAIQAAVREGGSGDSSVNLSLKNALAAAKSDDVSADSVERAIERGLGSSEGNASAYETATYEGYGPHGVAILIEALTDNRNRTAAEVRHVFNKHGGDMSGNTAWQFESKGIIVLSDADETVQELAIDWGADDLFVEGPTLTIYTQPQDLHQVAEALQVAGHELEFSQLTKVPQTEISLLAKDAANIASMLESFEDLEDVQNVYSTASLDMLDLAS